MFGKRFSLFCVVLSVAVWLSACGGSSKPSVAVTASSSTVDGGDAVTLTATVTHDKTTSGTEDGVTWTVSGGGSSSSDLTATTSTSATFTAPTATSSAQTITVTATSKADTAVNGTATITVPAAPAITTTAVQLAGAVGTAYSVTLAGSGGISPYIWTLDSTSAPLPTCLTMTAGVISGAPVASCAGTYAMVFDLTDSGTATPLTAQASLSLYIAGATPISFTGTMPATATYESSSPYVGFATATGGAGALTYSVSSGSLPPGLILMSTGNGEIGGTPTAVGTYSFTMKAADAFGDSATQAYTITVSPATPTLAFTTIPTQTYGVAPFTVSAASASTGMVTYSVTSGPATISGSSVTITGVGTVILGASQVATTNYTAATASTSFTVSQETPTLTFATIPSHTYGDAPFTVSATSASSGLVTYSVTSGPATISGSSVTLTGAGTVVLGASQAATTDYAATTASVSFTVYAEAPTLTFTTIDTQTYGVAPFTVSASSTSSAAITYSVTSGPATISGSTVTITGVGTVVLGASQAAAGNYGPATASTSFTVNQATPTLVFATIPVQAFGNAPITVSATSASTGLVTYLVTSGPATISGSSVTLTGPGTVNLSASQAATANYIAATATTSFLVDPELVITAPTIPTFYPGTPYPTTQFTATGGSGTYSSWSWTAASGSTLPAGLSLSATGAITGTPTNTTTLSVVSLVNVKVTDSVGNTTTTQYPITIEAPLAIATASPLPTGTVGNTYSQTLTATGGTGAGTYTWSFYPSSSAAADTTCLSGLGMSLSSTGAITSSTALTNSNVGSCTFSVQLADNAVPAHTVTGNFTIAVSTFAITTTSPLPVAYTGTAYSQPLTAVGGSVSDTYQWTVSINNTGFAGLGLSINSSNGTISGTAAGLVAGSATFTVSVTDTTINATATQQFTLNVYNPLSLTAPSSSVPGPAIYNTAYTGSTITASGGSGNYSWSLNSTLPAGWSYSNPTGSTLVVSGMASYIPTTPSIISFYVTLTDTTTGKTTGQIAYSISVGPATPLTLQAGGSLSSATMNSLYNGGISTSGGSGSGYVFSINGTAVPTDGTPVLISDSIYVFYNGGNSLNISGTPTQAGTVTLTNVTVTDGAGDNAGPDTYTITVNPVIPTGYTVSGTVNYTGSQAGWVYLELIPNNGCNGCSQNLGTAIDGTLGGPFASPKAYTIHGVPAGTYTLKAYMDGIGYGLENASDPTGSLSNLNVTGSGLSGQNFTLQDPSAVSLGTLTPTWDPSQGSGVFSGGAVVSFDPICNGSGCNNGGVEMPTSYNLEYSTDPTFNSGFTNKHFPADGGNSPWIVTGLITGQTYYFRAAGLVGNTSGNYSAASSGVAINAPTAGSALSGTVTFAPPTGVTLAGGPLYVGCYASGTLYAQRIASPVSPQAYSVTVPNGTSCLVFGFLDQFSSGMIGGPGELSNTNQGIGMIGVTVNGATPNQNITLPSSNSTVEVKTQTNSDSNGTGYGVGFQVYGEYKLPVAVELLSETPNVSGTVVDVVLPADIATDAFNNYNNEFDYWPQVTGIPVVGDSYTFNVTYSDGTSENLNAAVTGVLDAFATSLSPTGTGVSLTPNFSWDYPSSAGSYLYQFELDVNNGNTVWQIPPHNSSSNGFASTMTPFITWDVDPTNTGDLPDSHYLSNGGLLASTNYNWSISAYDANMNEAKVSASFTTSTASLSLPAGNTGYALINTLYEQSLNASGGLGTYTFTVNGTSIPTNGINNAVSIASGNGLEAFSSGNQLTIFGTPTAGPITLNVSVTDGTNTTQQTYTITVAALTGAHNSYLNGTYVCKSDGYDQIFSHPWSELSSLTLDGAGASSTSTPSVWNLTENLTSGSGTETITYKIGADNNGLMTVTPNVGSASTWAVALSGNASPATEFRRVLIGDVGTSPTNETGSSVCYLATTSAVAPSTLSGKSFAFGWKGTTSSTKGSLPQAYVGRLTLSTISGSSGTVASGITDGMSSDQTADSGKSYLNSTTYPSTYTAPDTYGRSTILLTPTDGTPALTMTAYIIDTNRLFIIATGGGTGALSGEMRLQQQSANTAAALLSGSSVLYSQRFDGNSSGSVTGYGSMLLQVSGVPASTYTDTATVNASFEDDEGTYKVGQENGGNIAITLDSNNPGRATFSPGGGDSAFFYFFNAGSAFYLDLNGTKPDLETGWLEAQTQTTFTNAALAGDYLLGKLPPVSADHNDAIGELNLLSNGNITGSATTGGEGDFTWEQAIGMSYSWASPTYGTFTTGTGTKDLSCAVISATKDVCIVNGSGSAEMMILQE